MGLDILTERGQETVQQEADAVALFNRSTNGWEWKHTSKEGTAIVDGLLFQAGVLSGVVETKCRTCDLTTFRNQFKNEWLITFQKIEDAKRCATLLAVPLYGFLYLTPCKTLLMQKISDEEGQFTCQFRVEQTVTQRTVNGGSAIRSNAFISMKHAKEFTHE